MRDRAIETFRSILTVTGLVLLVVFGSRAAGQAQNKQLAGATHNAVQQLLQSSGATSLLGLDNHTLAPAYRTVAKTPAKPTEKRPHTDTTQATTAPQADTSQSKGQGAGTSGPLNAPTEPRKHDVQRTDTSSTKSTTSPRTSQNSGKNDLTTNNSHESSKNGKSEGDLKTSES